METIEHNVDRRVPASLEIIQDVVNTRYGRTRPDDWKSLEQLQIWLIQHQLLTDGVRLTQGDHRRMIEVRESLRALLRANNAQPLAPEHVETLNHIAKHAPLQVHFQLEGQANLVPDIDGIDGVIGFLLGVVYSSMSNGTWSRLKVCRNERCQKAFYDHSKNHSGSWCSMATCGSRDKARAYRKRQQERGDEDLE